MAAFSSNASTAQDYDLRSLNHERRMLGVYRARVSSDGSLLQPLANACWRAASFEWGLYKNAVAVRHLWSEGARALVEGFARRRTGFDPSPDQLILAFHLTTAARTRDAFTSLASIAPRAVSG